MGSQLPSTLVVMSTIQVFLIESNIRFGHHDDVQGIMELRQLKVAPLIIKSSETHISQTRLYCRNWQSVRLPEVRGTNVTGR